MVERNSKITDKRSKKKDGRKQKGEKSSELKQRIKKYKSEQQRKKKGGKTKEVLDSISSLTSHKIISKRMVLLF